MLFGVLLSGYQPARTDLAREHARQPRCAAGPEACQRSSGCALSPGWTTCCDGKSASPMKLADATFQLQRCLSKSHRWLLRSYGTYSGRRGRAESSASDSSWCISLCCGDGGFRPYGCPVSGLTVLVSKADDELPVSASLVQIADGVGDFAEQVSPIDHWCELAGVDLGDRANGDWSTRMTSSMSAAVTLASLIAC